MGLEGRWDGALSLSNSLTRFIKAVGHDDAHREEVVGWPEATNGDISLRVGGGALSVGV